MMRPFSTVVIAVALTAMCICGAFAHDGLDTDAPSTALHNTSKKARTGKTQGKGNHWLTTDNRLSLLAAALDTHVQREAEPDCSHLVHAIYEAAGFPYHYVPSSDLYAGGGNFMRVKAPLPGDLVVWRGHVGIVIKPSRHIFFSYLSSGPGTDNYEADYWKHRGQPRFYRYIKKKFGR